MIAAHCKRIADSGLFQGFILLVIVLNAIALGVQTYDISPGLNSALTTIDDVFLAIFTVEIAIRVVAFGRAPWDFFRDGWNLFDFVVVGVAYVPFLRENITMLRVVRLLRVVRVLTVLPDLRILVRAMVRSIPPIVSLLVLTILIMYLYGMLGWILFGEEDPENWGNIGDALISTFTMLTLENWPALLEAGMEIHPWSWVFFVSYVLIASFLVINILIAIIINSMEEVHEAERAAERAKQREEAEAGGREGATLAERLAHIRASIDALEADLARDGVPIRQPERSARRTAKGGRARG
ncbi:MAG TPA: ion transporter [Solirubrobacterales bacterium]